MARRVYNPRAGVIAGVFCMLHPSFLRYVSDFHLETLLTFLFTLAVWRSVVFVERPNWRNGALFGVASGLAALTKAVVLVYPAVFGAVWLFTQRRTLLAAASERGAKLLALAAVFVAMGLTISPWTIRNYFATDGRFVLIGTGASDAFLRGYVFSQWKYATLQEPPYTGAENEVNITFAAMCKEEGVDWNRDDLETDATLGRIAKRRLLSDPIAFVRKSFVGVFTFWYQMTSFKTSLVAGLSALAGWILALIGMPRAARERRRAWLFVAPPLFLNFQLAVLLALGRYSVPILPCLMVLAAFGLDTLIERLQSKKGAATVS
jgi:4-amino-4-deoxy-L-arabinose transferase-like glycosyltransferase